MENEHEHVFKLLLAGDAHTGKSSLLLKFADDVFSSAYICTIGVDFKIKKIQLPGTQIKLQIWDTAGQERFRTITSSYYKGAHGIIIAYDITNRQSFTKLENWLEEVSKYASDTVSTILVGMKSDDEENRQVSFQEGVSFAENHGMKFFEASAKNGINVEEVFTTLTSVIKQKIDQQGSNNNTVKAVQKIEQKKEVNEEKEVDLYDLLAENGVGDVTMQILRSEEVKTIEELNYLKDEDLKDLGIKLGEIARIRKIK